MILAATGHRPNKLGGYDAAILARATDLAAEYLEEVSARDGLSGVITGMALGWDTAVALAAIRIGLPFIAAIPYRGQEDRWSPKQQIEYVAILTKAARAVVVSTGFYAPWKYQVRDVWMIDRADRVVALWDGSDGGTANTVRYAESPKGLKPVVNLWGRWCAKT